MIFSSPVSAEVNGEDNRFSAVIDNSPTPKNAEEFMEHLSTQKKSQWMKSVHEFLKDDPGVLTREQRKMLAGQIAADPKAMAELAEYQQMHYQAYPDEAWWYFLARLDDADQKVRLDAVAAFSWIFSYEENCIEEIARVLVEAMGKDVPHADQYVVNKVIDLLKKKAQSGSEEAERLLREGVDLLFQQLDLQEKDNREGLSSSGALGVLIGGLQGPEFNEAVDKLLVKLDSPNPWVRQSTQTAFLQLMPGLQGSVLDDVVNFFLTNIRTQESYQTIEIFGQISFPLNQGLMEGVVQRLTAALEDIPMAQVQAARSLGAIAPLLSDDQLAASFLTLRNHLGDDSIDVRREVIRSLSKIVSYLPELLVKDAIPAFLVGLEDQDQLSRQDTQEGLNNAAVRLNGKSLEEFAEMLLGKLQHPDEYVRGAAVLLLKDKVTPRLTDGQLDKAREAVEQALKVEERGWIQDNLNSLLQSVKSHEKVQ